MEISLTSTYKLNLVSPLVSLGDLHPVVNGERLAAGQAEVLQNSAGKIIVRYPIDAGVFGIAISQEAVSGRCWLYYWLEGLAENFVLDSFGICFSSIKNLRAYLRNGYNSWDGSFYVEPEGLQDFEPYEHRPETGFAMTQLLPRYGTGSVVIGFDRHERFQHTFTFDTRQTPLSLTVLTLWDQKDRTGLERCESERLVIFEHPEVEEGLREWARIVAEASPTPPRHTAQITGWCSWYNLYAYINEQNILDHLHGAAEVAQREQLPMRVFQIDDGFTPEMGDWLKVKPQFPRGMKALMDDIRAAGFIPGLWIGPFMVGNRSQLYQEHPDWVLKDRQTGGPFVQWRMYGEFRWHKRSEEYYVLDTTHPDAFEYLRQVFHTWRHEWGCEYFKTDFMLWGSDYGPDRVIWHKPGLSRIEIWRRVAEMIREEIGEDAIWLGCGCPLWVTVGLVDGIRIGSDVGVSWRGHLSAESLLRDQASRNFANHILWQIDADCILLRERFHHLTETELRSLAIYAGMSGGVIITSDALDELSADRLRLWKLLLSSNDNGCNFPLLGQSSLSYKRFPADRNSHQVRHETQAADPVLVQVRTSQDGVLTAVFIFNISENPLQRSYPLSQLGLSGPLYVYDWTSGCAWPEPVERLTFSLPSHGGVLLFLSPSPITSPIDRLP